MTLLIIEQLLNGLQFGLMLFLLAAGLTLVFGVMDVINLAHGSLYMIGAFLMAGIAALTGSFWMALPLALAATAGLAWLLEISLIKTLYRRDHLTQVLATFALILIANDVVRLIWGSQPLPLNAPEALAGPVELLPGLLYPAYRLLIIACGAGVAIALFLLINHTQLGMWLRAGASDREMAEILGVKVKPLFAVLFAFGGALCALAGALLGPLSSVQIGMGEHILIPAFVVVVIGGIGSIRGAFAGALLVGMADTLGRAFLPMVLREIFSASVASNLGPALASMLIYLLMALVLFFRPAGLFPARG
jgi:branched-chain amino acid transport system permease protein